MKTIAVAMAALLLMLSGCAAQTDDRADDRPGPVQTERAAPADTSKEEAPRPEAAEGAGAPAETAAAEEGSISEAENTGLEDAMRLLIGETEVPVTWEENASVDALRALCPVTIQMSMYGGFEQVGSLGTNLPRNDKQTTTEAGDIVLYSGNQIVVFYGSNSWAYTRLGKIKDKTAAEMTDLLSNGNVTITISYGGQQNE